MDRITILLMCLFVPFGLFILYWYVSAFNFKSHIKENLEITQAAYDEAGSGLNIAYDDMEISGFPFGPKLRIENPSIIYLTSEREMTLSMPYLDVTIHGESYERIQVQGPLNASAIDNYQGTEFPYEITFISSIPSMMVRTPKEELRLPRTTKNPLMPKRVTPSETLQQLPRDLYHQYAIMLPREVTMIISYGQQNNTLRYTSMGSVRANWKPIPYRFGSSIKTFIDHITQTTHYQGKGLK